MNGSIRKHQTRARPNQTSFTPSVSLLSAAYSVLKESKLSERTFTIPITLLSRNSLAIHLHIRSEKKKWHLPCAISPRISSSASYPSSHPQRSAASPAHRNASPRYVARTAKSGTSCAIEDGGRRLRSRNGETVESRISSSTGL